MLEFAGYRSYLEEVELEIGDKVKLKGEDKIYEIVGFDERNSIKNIILDDFIKDNDDYNFTYIHDYEKDPSVHYSPNIIRRFSWVSFDEIEIVKPYSDLIRVQYGKFGDVCLAKIIYQNFDIFPRGEFKDEELNVYSVDGPSYNIQNNKILILGSCEYIDDDFIKIPLDDLNYFKCTIEELNKKYFSEINNIPEKDKFKQYAKEEVQNTSNDEKCTKILDLIFEYLDKFYSGKK